jgi:Domain of unknown function (DUF1906)
MTWLDVVPEMKFLIGKALLGGVIAGSLIVAPVASAETETQTVRYRGAAFKLPASWPVYRLAADPSRCVRLDRRAVYLGRPGPDQRCPAHVVGRPRAILVEPTAAGARRVFPGETAPVAPPGDRPAVRGPAARAQASAGYFTGLGFDACSAPSVTTMAAWLSSPYRAIGVYIGGINRGCIQPNLTSDWVAGQIAAGWVLIPTYVGLQAPADVCGCASISPSQAAVQGAAAAEDAVVQAAGLGIGPGNPIYYDMEGYSQTSTNTSAVLTFLDAWTERLHARGYVSGVYGSASSTIEDLVSQYGLGFSEPDDVWIAHWDGVPTANDSYVPASYWSNHQRIRQYRGGHNERYGGVTINIDNDYVDGAVVGAATRPFLPRLRCEPVTFSRRPVSIAYRIRTFNLRYCGKARRLAAATEPRRFTASGRTRRYSKVAFACEGDWAGRVRVVFTCRRERGRSKVIFVRKG